MILELIQLSPPWAILAIARNHDFVHQFRRHYVRLLYFYFLLAEGALFQFLRHTFLAKCMSAGVKANRLFEHSRAELAHEMSDIDRRDDGAVAAEVH